MKKDGKIIMIGDGPGAAGRLIAAGGAGAHLLNEQMQRYIEDFKQMRVACYEEDRLAALRELDPILWKRFSYRWNICPAFPHGFGSDEELLAIMHKTRLALAYMPGQDHFAGFIVRDLEDSAAWLIAHGVSLPDGLTFENGRITGEVKPPSRRE